MTGGHAGKGTYRRRRSFFNLPDQTSASLPEAASVAGPRPEANGTASQESTNVITPLIVGGTEVPVGAKTFIVGLRDTLTGASFCGGTLITPKHVLSAAHCYDATLKYVVVGTHFLQGSSDGETIKIIKKTMHPQFRSPDTGYDFMVLELATDARFGPADLTAAVPRDGSITTVAGWGHTTSSNVALRPL